MPNITPDAATVSLHVDPENEAGVTLTTAGSEPTHRSDLIAFHDSRGGEFDNATSSRMNLAAELAYERNFGLITHDQFVAAAAALGFAVESI